MMDGDASARQGRRESSHGRGGIYEGTFFCPCEGGVVAPWHHPDNKMPGYTKKDECVHWIRKA